MTDVACKGLHAGMYELMFLEVDELVELFVAYITGERFLTGMNARVNLQTHLTTEGFGTYRATKRYLLRRHVEHGEIGGGR